MVYIPQSRVPLNTYDGGKGRSLAQMPIYALVTVTMPTLSTNIILFLFLYAPMTTTPEISII